MQQLPVCADCVTSCRAQHLLVFAVRRCTCHVWRVATDSSTCCFNAVDVMQQVPEHANFYGVVQLVHVSAQPCWFLASCNMYQHNVDCLFRTNWRRQKTRARPLDTARATSVVWRHRRPITSSSARIWRSRGCRHLLKPPATSMPGRWATLAPPAWLVCHSIAPTGQALVFACFKLRKY